MPSATPRDRLIEAAVQHGAEHGLSDTSLRQLAAALGTSHRMLLHHFGSKEGLLVEVVRRVEARQRQRFEDQRAEFVGERSTGAGPAAHIELSELADLGARFWASLTDPEVQQHERLFFEIYGQALQGRAWALPLLDGIVDHWVEPMAAMFESFGAAPETSRIDARLAVAVARGLLLDVLATGDRTAVDAAMARFNELVTR